MTWIGQFFIITYYRPPCVPGQYMSTTCAWYEARWARGTFQSSAALCWTPHLDPVCWPSAKRVDQICLQPRHWPGNPVCSHRDSSASGSWLPWLIHVTVVTFRDCSDSSRRDSSTSESGSRVPRQAVTGTYPGTAAGWHLYKSYSTRSTQV